MARILVIEDEPNLRYGIVEALRGVGHDVLEADCLAGARLMLGKHRFDVVLTDVHLGGENGTDLIGELRKEGYEGVIAVLTAHGSVEHAVEAMKLGADDYLQKPVGMEQLRLHVSRWLDQVRSARRLRLYERLEQTRSQSNALLGESKAWLDTMEMARRLASVPLSDPTDEAGGGLPTVLLTGETGVGKGAIARYIHTCAVADRKEGKPDFVHVNCAAIPASLVEGELFGHEKGSFTDAKEAKPGLFEMADGGTIFLDEIGEMPVELQSKLLLVVEQGVFRRVGGQRDQRVRTRIITATNQDLESRSREGTFRRDLYFRLSTFPIEIPPLRERRGDALLIAEHLLSQFARRYGRDGLAFGDDAKAAINGHGWPGNVRELANAVQRAAMLASGDRIGAGDLSLTTRQAKPQTDGIVFDFEHGLHRADEVERELMVQALEWTRGNVSRAARLIGMQRSSFRYRIDRYGLEEHIRGLVGQ